MVECELERARKRNGKGKGKERERVLRSRREGEAEEEGDVRRPGRRKMKSVGKMGRSREVSALEPVLPMRVGANATLYTVPTAL